MKLGFYYHIPIRNDEGTLTTAGYLGCFLDSLADQVEELVLMMHETKTLDTHRRISLALGPNSVEKSIQHWCRYWSGTTAQAVQIWSFHFLRSNW